jgi:hypothetical protein
VRAAERLAQMELAFLALALAAGAAYARRVTHFRETAMVALVALSMCFGAFLAIQVLLA